MVLTERQRSDLHAGIYEYLLSRGPDYAVAAEAFAAASGVASEDNYDNGDADNDNNDDGNKKKSRNSRSSGSGGGPILEKKWTAVPRLQRRVLELERQVATNARLHAHRTGGDSSGDGSNNSTMPGRDRRMLPRPPAVHTLQSHSAVVTSVSLHPVYTMAASASEDGTIKLWDHESGEYLRTLRGHTNVVTSVDFSPGQGKFLASTSTDLSIKIWDVKEFTCVRTLRGHDHTISCVRFVPPPIGALFLEKSNQNNNLQQQQQQKVNEISSGGIDPSEAGSKFIVTASRDATVKFWDLETGFCDHTISDHSDWVRCIAVRGAKSLTTTGSSNTKGEEQSGGDEQAQASSASLALVATSGNDRTIYVYDANDKRTKVCELRGHDHVVEALSFLCSSLLPQKGSSAPSSKASSSSSNSTWDYLASGSRDRTVRLWTVANGGSCLMTFRAHENWVRGVLVHPSGNHIMSCGDDRSIRVYDIKSNRCMRTIEDAHPHFVTSLSMHPTLPIMISGGVDHTVKCWQLD